MFINGKNQFNFQRLVCGTRAGRAPGIAHMLVLVLLKCKTATDGQNLKKWLNFLGIFLELPWYCRCDFPDENQTKVKAICEQWTVEKNKES